MILSLFALSSSIDFGPHVAAITSERFAREVERRDNKTVWFLMFHGANCPACKQTYPEFIEASHLAAGMVKFGQIDSDPEILLATRYRVTALPTFLIFHPKGKTVGAFRDFQTAKAMVTAAIQKIPNLAITINESWLALPNLKAAVLLTNKQKVPPLWAAISCNFSSTIVKIGTSNNESIHKVFGVKRMPAVVLIDGERRVEYEGPIAFQILQDSIVKFFGGSVTPTPAPTPTPKPLVRKLAELGEFNTTCRGKATFCVIEGADEIDPLLVDTAKRYTPDPLEFFVCGPNCPLEWARTGVWVLHHKRDAGIRLDSLDDIDTHLQRVIDGSIGFKPLTTLIT
jgi:thiol-disulfide isomerase/thioredoxin